MLTLGRNVQSTKREPIKPALPLGKTRQDENLAFIALKARILPDGGDMGHLLDSVQKFNKKLRTKTPKDINKIIRKFI
jgi:hypothetical protein